MLLSYILPVYNTEKFLKKCLNSIIKQNLPFDLYEIVVINDGSTDGSDKEFYKWKSHNPNVNVNYIVQSNKGLSGSRNVGITHAKGTYIWFVDSDDYLFDNVCDRLLKEITDNDLDVLWFDHQLVDLNEKILQKPCEDIKTGINETVMKGADFLTKNFKNSCMVWAFLIKKSLIIDNNLFFVDGVYFEDIIFTPQIIFKACRIKYINIEAINYVIHSNSIMRNNVTQKKRIMDSLIVVKKLTDFSRKENNLDLHHYLDMFTGAILLYNYRLSISLKDKYFLDSFKKNMRDFGLYPFKIKKPLQRNFLAKVANFSPYIFEKLSYLRPIQ